MKQLRSRLLGLSLFLLAACSQTPVGHSDTPTVLKPLNFGTSQSDGATSLAHHSAGVYVAGMTQGRLHSTPQGEFDIFVRKVDASGKLLWGRQFGTRRGDYLAGIANDSGNNVYVAGVTAGNLAGSKGREDNFVRKYSPVGKPLWTVQFGTRGRDYTSGIAVDGDNVYVAGTIEDYNAGSLTGFVRKFASDGQPLWQKTVSGYSFTNDVTTDNYGNIYILGVYDTPDHEGSLFLRKYTPAGSILWTKEFQGDLFSYGNLAVDGSSIYIAGNEYNPATDNTELRLIKFNTAGSRQWIKTFNLGRSASIFDLSACGGEIVVGGQLFSNHPTDYVDGFTLKLTPQGSRVWLKRQATDGLDTTGAVRVTSMGVYAAGITDGKLGSNVYGLEDAFITRLRNRGGDTVWVK